ncbi:MAG: CopD family protein [Pseudolabrys sp.]
MLSLALTLHLLSAVVWVGGMFAAYMCLRPAAGPLEPPQRLGLWRRFFAKFFPWVWVSVVLLLATGLWMMVTFFGGMSAAPVYIHVMMGLGILMMLIYAWLFHGPWLKFKRAVDAGDWPAAGAQLNRIRLAIAVNLPLGLIVVIIGGTGRYWGA